MVKGVVSPLRLFSRASPKKAAQDVAPANGPAVTGGRPPLCSIPEAAFNPVTGDANNGQYSSPPRKAGLSTPSEKKRSTLGQGSAYPHLENLDASCTPPASGIPQGLAKAQIQMHQRQHSSSATEFTEAQGPSSGQSASARSVSRALKYNTHQTAPAGPVGLGNARSQPQLNSITRTPSLPKCGPPQQSIAEQQFDLEEDPTFWRDHNVQVLIRSRPLSSSEIAAQGFARCVRQESAHTITWIGQPESRFTFDHVACESISQEKLFRVAGLPMVDNCIAGYNSCMFAYGQTGSGKTHTMLGDIDDLDSRPSSNRGMTPRVFEYLFARIRHEEESRRHEHLKYQCKCSFLEIYNEQITDLLDPTSNNLQMREDAKKGVYVENLTEVEVLGLQDVIQLLLQGAANRKVAATHMNRESSRSHSVFTCVVESKWEYDSMMNTRFGRLNLVDLAGSERQKTSGAEGERLKEAANINKSLSTLGLVIMVLVDIANGKQRHVPYRDSKLTFLLQDSLGGNSKTTIIANVSPSSGCSMETLSTLKFAQRAKFIRNNAVVNEDASADVLALREQIRQLQDEVSRLRRQATSRSASFRCSMPLREAPEFDGTSMAIVGFQSGDEPLISSCDTTTFKGVASDKAKAVEALLAGAFRREQEAENTSKRLAGEIEKLGRLVRQREEDTQCTKMMLRFREDKIRRLEGVADGILSAEQCLLEEKAALQEELHIVRSRIDRNPELTRFAMENIRLTEEVRRYQEFYEGMERDLLLQEIGTLRDQLIEVFEGKQELPQYDGTIPTISEIGDTAGSRKADEELMELRLQVQSYAGLIEDKERQRNELEGRCMKLNQEVGYLKERLDKFATDAAQKTSAGTCARCSSPVDQVLEAVNLQSEAPTCEFLKLDPNKERISVSNSSASKSTALKEPRASDIASSMRHAEEIMQLQLQLESYEALLEQGQTERRDLESRCAGLTQRIDQLSRELEDAHKVTAVENSSTSAKGISIRSSRTDKIEADIEICEHALHENHVRIGEGSEAQEPVASRIAMDEKIQVFESQLREVQKEREDLSEQCKNLLKLVDDSTKKLKDQTDREKQMDVTRGQVEAETAQTIKQLHTELMELKKGTASTRESREVHSVRELMNDVDTRALFEAAAEVDEMMDEAFSIRLSIDHTSLRGSYRAADRKGLEVIQRKLQTAHALARETEAQFLTVSNSVLEMSDAHRRETERLKEQIRLSEERMAAKETELAEHDASLQKLRTSVEMENTHRQEMEALKKQFRLSEERRIQLELDTLALAEKLKNVHESLKAHDGLEGKWRKEKDQLLLDVHEARMAAKQKASESATLLQRFEEGQAILLELEETMNALVRANETRAETWRADQTKLQLAQQEIATLHANLQRSEDVKKGLLQEMTAELEVQREELERLRAAVQDLEQQLVVKSVEVEDKKVALCKLEGAMCDKEKVLNSLSDEVREAKGELVAVRQQRDSVEAALLRASESEADRLHSAKTELDLARREIATLQDNLQKAEDGRKGLESDIRCLQESTAEMKIKREEAERFGGEVVHLEQQLKVKCDEIEEMKVASCKLEDVIHDKEKMVNSAQQEITSLQDKLQRAEDGRKGLESDIRCLQESTAEMKIIREDAERLGAEVMHLRQQLKVKCDEIEEMKVASCKLEGVIQNKEHIVNLAQREIASLQDKLQRAEDGRKGLESDIRCLQESTAEMKIKREDAERFEAEVVRLKEQLKLKCDEIEDMKVASCKLEGVLHDKENLVNSLAAELEEMIALVRANDAQAETWRADQTKLELAEQEIATLHENLQRSEDLKKGLEFDISLLQESTAELSVHRDEVERLGAAITHLEQQLAVKCEEIENKTIALSKLEGAMCDKEKMVNSLSDELLAAKQELVVVRQQRSTIEAELVRANAAEADRSHSARAEFDFAQQEIGVLQEKLQRAVDARKRLESDTRLLQESSAEMISKREETERLAAEVQHLQSQLEVRAEEVEDLKVALCKLEGTIYDKENMLNSLSDELLETRGELEVLRKQRESVETELNEKRRAVADLEIELLDAISLEQDTARNLKTELNYAIKERTRLHAELLVLTEQLDMAQAIAEEQASLACEARQVSEASKALLEGKNAEVRLLERSVDELESTVTALESQVGIVKREGERQRLLREDLEMELQSFKHHMSTVQVNNEEKEVLLLQPRKPNTTLVSSNKSTEKPKPKTSTSPFKCGSKGLVQQMQLDIDEEIHTNREKIEELEGIAAARQKEVFLLHTRLAEAESMTHDVIRDLLGVKLDITSCASLLSQEKVQQIAEAARKRTDEAKEKEAELSSVRAQLTEFIEERESWLEEINRRQAEMVAARVSAEKLRLRQETLTAENERFQREATSQRKRIQELEAEVKKLSGQQNLQQRIHHHAKIKEENNVLRTQNEDLSSRLRRTEMVLARVSDELARYRTAEGKPAFLNIDEENRLKNQLKEEEDNRIQIAQKLIGLSTAVMKAAGVGTPPTEVDSDVAFKAVYQLEDRLRAAERELSDMKLQTRIAGEKRRLSDLRAGYSPLRTNFSARIQENSPRVDR